MKVGDLVRRKNIASWGSKNSNRRRVGIVIELGITVGAAVWVMFGTTRERFAPSHLEVINENR